MQKSRLETVMKDKATIGSFSINPMPLPDADIAVSTSLIAEAKNNIELTASSQSTPTTPKRRMDSSEPSNESTGSNLEDETNSTAC